MRLIPTLFASLLATSAAAAEKPLGQIESCDGRQLVLRFDSGARLVPGSMVAIYAPGKLEKHPLTKEVIIERPVLIAKAQLIGGDDAHPLARVLWPEAPEGIVAGLDVVPLSEEAAPNSQPSAGQPTKVSAVAQTTTVVKAPISDPDGDLVTYTWTLTGSEGSAGRLDARTTTAPEVPWTAPGKPGTAMLSVVARDSAGHETTLQTPLETTPLDDPRKRELQVFGRWDETTEPGVSRIERDGDGTWWGLSEADARVIRIHPGWLGSTTFRFAAGTEPRAPIALATWRKELYVLDGKTTAVSVFGVDGLLKRTVGHSEKPTDLAIAADGTLYIADQTGGGIQVHEADGRFRCRIGRAGGNDDDFAGLSRIALGPAGELYALDAVKRRIHRFDRFQRRQPTWTMTGDASLQPVDLAVHPRGVMLLMASGHIQVYDAKGLSREMIAPLSESQLAADVGKASSLTVDGTGDMIVTYAASKLVARHSSQGAVTGVRGMPLRASPLVSADGSGRIHALDTEDGYVYSCDAEGWRCTRSGGLAKRGGPFANPIALAAGLDGQTVAVLDAKKMAVVRLRPGTKEAPLVFGQPGKNNGQFEDPIALAVDESGRTYVLDQDLYRVSIFDEKGSFLFAFGSEGKGAHQLKEPKLIAVAPDGSAAFVYDASKYEVKKFALDFSKNAASHVTNTGGKGDGPGQIRELVGLGCDRQGILYLIDSSREDVQAVDFRGNSAVTLFRRTCKEAGVPDVSGLALSPDGQPWLVGTTTLVGLRWKPLP
ncbi:MAG: hypothetical protein H0V44_12430 [Planctomycetes bacterium]|nr:hypothetical protein [Planctomycetota bacterium]